MGISNHWALRGLLLLHLLYLIIVQLPACEGTPFPGSISDNSTNNNNHTNGSGESSDYSNNGNTNGFQDTEKRISKLLSSAQRVTVLVVGGGVSGLSTVETLLSNGVNDILLLEASCRLGGRVHTIRRDGVLVEEGAEWIHGDKRNPVYKIANNLTAVGDNIPDEQQEWLLVTENGTVHDEYRPGTADMVQKSSDDCHDNEETSNWDLLMKLWEETEANGVLAPYYHTGYGQYFIDRFPEVFGDKANSTEGRALIHALEQLVNGDEGCNSWLDISARDADAYVSHGEDHQWKDGYDTLITYILDKIPSSKIHLSSPVSEVYWDQDSNDGVLVVTSNGRSFLAQHVVFTASVAYLQKHHQNIFSPSLPKYYIKALEGISLGVADKIQIGWDVPWWSDTRKPFSINILWTNMDLPKEMSWLYGVVEVFSVFQQPTVLQMFITGDNAKVMECLTEDQVKTHVMYLLERITNKSVPSPIFFNRSQWGLNPWTLGSYSSFITLAGNKGGLYSRKPFAKSLYNSRGKMVLSWAGEHTHNTRYGTVDGARQSGIREATRILKLINA